MTPPRQFGEKLSEYLERLRKWRAAVDAIRRELDRRENGDKTDWVGYGPAP